MFTCEEEIKTHERSLFCFFQRVFCKRKAIQKRRRSIDGAEPMEFIALFKIWTDVNAQKGLGKTYTKGHIGKYIRGTFDIFYSHMIFLILLLLLLLLFTQNLSCIGRCKALVLSACESTTCRK